MEPGRFLELVVTHRPEARGEIDAVGLHTYAKLPGGHIKLLRHLRRRMGELSLGLPIVFNEFGWPTRGTTAFVTGERARAAYTSRVARAAALGDCGVASIAPYTWATPEAAPTDAEHWYGIADPRSARPYETARAYSRLLRRVRGPARAATRIGSGSARGRFPLALRFGQTGRLKRDPAAACFSTGPDPINTFLPCATAARRPAPGLLLACCWWRQASRPCLPTAPAPARSSVGASRVSCRRGSSASTPSGFTS